MSWSMSTSRNWARFPTVAAGAQSACRIEEPNRKSAASSAIHWSMTTPWVAYTEVLDSESGEACAGFILRAAEWFACLGYRIDRVMTDNALAYTRSHQFATALDTIGAAHKTIQPFRPQTNGKVERFHQTLLAGWAYRRHYQTNQQRRDALPGYIHSYNQTRPHSELGGQSPMTILVNNVPRKDT